MKTLITIILSMISLNAYATGETICHVETGAISAEVYLLNSRVPGSPVLNGEVIIKSKISGQIIKMDKDDMVGWWSQGKEIKMHFWIPGQKKEIRDTQLVLTATYSTVHGIFLGTARIVLPNGEDRVEIAQCELG